MEEKRIYSISPVIVDTDLGTRVEQPVGRQAAQHAHVVGAVWWRIGKNGGDCSLTTTILLQCRDTAELRHVIALIQKEKIKMEVFYDRNEAAYGEKSSYILTAMATHPVEPSKVVGILDYLHLLAEGK